jgi:hypothetical protein
MVIVGLGQRQSRFTCHLNMLILCKIVFPFPLSIGRIKGDFFKGGGDARRY